MKVKIPILGVTLVFVLVLLGITSQQAKADFIIDPDPGGLKFFIDVANKDVTSFTGQVDGQSSGVMVDVITNVMVTTGSGYATIKPSTTPPPKPTTFILTELTFTPVDGTLFGDFSFRGQLNAAGNVTVMVWDSLDFTEDAAQTFVFTIKNANQDFERIGIISTDETIYRVAILSDGFKEVKQINFSYAPVPEPATMLLLGSGLIGVGAFVRRKFKKQ